MVWKIEFSNCKLGYNSHNWTFGIENPPTNWFACYRIRVRKSECVCVCVCVCEEGYCVCECFRETILDGRIRSLILTKCEVKSPIRHFYFDILFYFTNSWILIIGKLLRKLTYLIKKNCLFHSYVFCSFCTLQDHNWVDSTCTQMNISLSYCCDSI